MFIALKIENNYASMVLMEKKYIFENGLRFVYVENSMVRTISLGVYVDTGSCNESDLNNGVSHFIEHMNFKGTTTRSAFDIVNEADSIGAHINAFTSKYHTCYYTISLDKNVEKCAEILSDLYFNATFPDDEMERERKVILEELSESEDDPSDVCLENLATMVCKGSVLEKTILGTKETLNAMTRQQLVDYKKNFYTADNTVIVLAGHIPFEKALELVKTNFADKFDDTKCVKNSVSKLQYVDGGAFQKKVADFEQCHIAIAFPAIDYYDKRDKSIQVMSRVLGVDMSSRLFQKIREQLGLCYTINTFLSFFKEGGMLTIYTATNPKNIEEALRAIREEILLFTKDGISEQELNKGKEQIKMGLVARDETTISLMRSFGRTMLFENELYDIDKEIALIDAVTVEEVLQVANEIFDFDKVCVSYVGKDSNADMLKIIKGE